jgi:hypothetical protein
LTEHAAQVKISIKAWILTEMPENSNGGSVLVSIDFYPFLALLKVFNH